MNLTACPGCSQAPAAGGSPLSFDRGCNYGRHEWVGLEVRSAGFTPIAFVHQKCEVCGETRFIAKRRDGLFRFASGFETD